VDFYAKWFDEGEEARATNIGEIGKHFIGLLKGREHNEKKDMKVNTVNGGRGRQHQKMGPTTM